MRLNLAKLAVALVVVVAVAGAVFRVSTAPERIKQRQETARSVCLASGGQWVKVDQNDICATAANVKP
jgi:hypothetical protein